jgi:hypothetical protein
MKWSYVVALKVIDSSQLIQFLEEKIMSRFEVPMKFITDNGSTFVGSQFIAFIVSMASSWGNLQIITPKVMGWKNLLIKCSYRLKKKKKLSRATN